MKHCAKIILSALLALTLLTSCTGPNVKLTYENDQFLNSKFELCYNVASDAWEPVTIGKAYAYYEESDLTFYRIEGANPKLWLTEGEFPFTVFYSDTITLPTLFELSPSEMHICSVSTVTFSLHTSTDDALISQILSLLRDGEEVEMPFGAADTNLEIKFHSSSTLTFLYYSVSYREYNGVGYLYDIESGKCVKIGKIISDLID